MSQYADVLLPLPVAGNFTYAVPPAMAPHLQTGCRVVVTFGKRKQYTGLVCRLHNEAPQGFEAKPIELLLDPDRPTVTPHQLRLWQWMANYYLCTPGEVYKAALPSGLKPESETVVQLNPDFEATASLSTHEQQLIDTLGQVAELTTEQLAKATGLKNILPLVHRLLEQGILQVKEELKTAYRPRTVDFVLPACPFDEPTLHRLMDSLKRAPKQLALLMAYVEMTQANPANTPAEVSKAELLQAAQSNTTHLKQLVDKGVFQVVRRETAHTLLANCPHLPPKVLTLSQQTALHQIKEQWAEKDVCLLHGVTSSGKTEIYMHLAAQAMAQGKQVLYLLPEIALTTQLTERLRRVFGDGLGVYHSKFPDGERIDLWRQQLGPQARPLILGARSALFLPFHNLGLVIVDEEHEGSYKQQDPAPRYHARDAAIVLASLHGAKVLLGTATPSIETLHNARPEGKYGLVRLDRRHGPSVLPHIVPVDTAELRRKKRMVGSFSPTLIQAMRQTLEEGRQVILFQNRRGFAPLLECRTCGWVPRCPHCDVSLTYHKGLHRLTCHYCDYTCPPPSTCPACAGSELQHRGLGTEKVEEELQTLFPQYPAARMDMDTTRSRTAYERIIADFEAGRTRILVGTQMVSKGLDFERVTLVGILQADTMLSYPDFRAEERAYQLMAQVAGRAGRRETPGTVVIQTRQPHHPIIAQVVANDYHAMAQAQLEERQCFAYPPFYRFIYIYLKHRQEATATRWARWMAERLRTHFGSRVLGPDHPPVGRVKQQFIQKIVLKVERTADSRAVRQYLNTLRQELLEHEQVSGLTCYYDVDPV